MFDSGARGVDRSTPSELADPRLGFSAVAVLSIWIVLLVGSHLAAPSLRTDELAIVGVSVVTALVLFQSWFTFILWRTGGDARAVTMVAAGVCLAVFPLLLGVLAPSLVHDPALEDLRPAAALAGLPGLFLLAASATRRRAGVTVRAGHLIGFTVLVSLAVLAVLAVPARAIPVDAGVALPLAGPYTSGPLALAFSGIARRMRSPDASARASSCRGPPWPSPASAARSSSRPPPARRPTRRHGRWLPSQSDSACTAQGSTSSGATADGRRRVGKRSSPPRSPSTGAQAVQDSQQEQRHQATAALLGIEAAAQGLSRNRALLTEPEFQQLSEGLVAEVHRLRSMIDVQRRETVTRFDLREAIEPVLTCTRAAGVELIDAVPAGIEVVGVPSKTAEACATLLRNAQDHAPGSIIEVRAEVGDGVATLSVDDRGPGLASAIADEAFERGVRSPTSRGSGLGLYVAHRLMQEQDGSIRVEARPGGGTSVVLEHRLAPVRLKAVAS